MTSKQWSISQWIFNLKTWNWYTYERHICLGCQKIWGCLYIKPRNCTQFNESTLVIVLDWKVGRTCRTMGNWMATRCGIYVVSMLRSRSILHDTTPSSIQDAKSTSLQCYRYLLADKGGNSCWWRIISCCKNCQQIDNLTCSWELQGTSLFCTMGIPWTTQWRLHNIVGSGPCNLG